MRAEAQLVVGGGEGGVDLRELEHHVDVKGADACQFHAKGQFRLGEGGGSDGGGEGGDVEVGRDAAAFKARGTAAVRVHEVRGDLGSVGDSSAEAVGEGSGAFDRGAHADFIAEGCAEVEDSGNGNAGTRNAGSEELFRVGKGINLFNGGNGGGELEHGREILGLSLQSKGFQAEQGDRDMSGKLKRA